MAIAMQRLMRVAASVFAAAVVAAFATAADQPQWGRWHSRNMVSDEKGLPETFDPGTGKNVVWTLRLGSETHSSPIVAGGRVYIGTNNDQPQDPRHKGDRGVLLCLDEKDGRLLWQLVVPKLELDPYWDWPSGGIVAGPTVEGDRAYVLSNRGEVMCLDVHGQTNGNDGPYQDEGKHMAPKGQPPMEVTKIDADIIWMYDLIAGVGIRQHDAAHCSVLIDGPFLYVNTSNGVDNTHRRIRSPDAPSLVVLDKATGRLVAQDGEHIGPRIFHSTWSSPALGEAGGRRLVFFGGGDGVCYAFEPLVSMPPAGKVLTLKKVWWFDTDPAGPKENVHQFTGNRQQSPSNIKSMPVFHKGRIYLTSGGDIWWGKNEARLQCIDPSLSGDVTKSGLLWTYPLNRHACSTPAVHDGLVYVTDCGRIIHCVDAETGKAVWTHEARGEMWGSALVADGKVYVGDRRGVLWILAAGREKRVLASVELGSPMNATPTAANGRLYIASMNHLYAVANRPEPAR